MNQRKEKPTARYSVTGKNSDVIYIEARRIAEQFFGDEPTSLYFEDAEPLVYVTGTGDPVIWKAWVTAVPNKRVPS